MAELQHGDALGASYRLAARIGSGAAGDVWTVDSLAGGPQLAAKILKQEHASDTGLVERFVRERSVLLGLRHENIVEVRDLVVEGSTLAIVMEFVPGGSLRDLLEGAGTLPAAEALTLGAQVFRALAAAHQQQVTHRDIKPDNVLLSAPWGPGQVGTVRVTDFGIASVVSDRNRQTTGLLGTPQYMAPELISHGQTTPAADIYSAGVMLYELLAGRTPFAGPGTDFTVAYRHVTSHPPQLDLPDPLWAALAQLLAKDPRDRPSAAEAAAKLSGLADRYRTLPRLAPSTEVDAFEEIERPATMLRSDLVPGSGAPQEYVSAVAAEAPELGDAGQHTVLRPMPRREPLVIPEAPASETPRGRFPWLTKKVILLGATGIILLGGLGVGLAIAFGGGTAEAAPVSEDLVQASQQDMVLPTGLSTARKAEFSPETGQVSLEITYAAQKAPLSGEFFQAVPPIEAGDPCPAVVWDAATGRKHQASTTGLKAECGWNLDGIEIPQNGQVTVTGAFTGTVADAAALDEWLGTAVSATDDVLTAQESISTAYPAQRLRDVSVKVPSRTVSQTPLEVTLLPVWPSGVDELNPLFKSPATGAPSQMLRSIVGDDDPVRFADGCSSAVSVAPDGVTVTALTVTSDCRLRASVGNFTSLESNPFSITTRE